MGIHVIQSQQIEVLVQGVLLRIQKPSKHPFTVFKTEHFVVPSPAMQEWLTQTIAEQQGISANTQFHQRIRGFQWFCYQQVLDDKDHVRKANIPRLMMKWRIYQSLKSFIEPAENQLNLDHPLFSIVHRIFESASQLEDGIEKQLKKQSMLYWVSEQVSKLFSNYMVYRGYCQKGCGLSCQCPTNWLNVWGQNQSIDLEEYFPKRVKDDKVLNSTQDEDVEKDAHAFKFTQAQELEAWQRWLWQHTFHDDFMDMQKIDDEFWRILDDPERRVDALKKLPSQAIIFTVLDLPPSQLQFLRRLGQYIDIYLFHYNPSQEYWADMVDPNWKASYDLKIIERFIEKNKKRNIEVSDSEIKAYLKNFNFEFNAQARESNHPLLIRFGKQARDNFSLLSILSSGEEGDWKDNFFQEYSDKLLGKLQSDILNLENPKPYDYLLNIKDDSIQIHVCHSGLRQLEVLKEQLLYWLSQGTAEQPRRPSDILVLAPDLKQIEPLIRSVFPQSRHQDGVYLPIKIAGVTQTDVNNAWRAVLGRISLVSGRFSLEDFADWLSLTATQQRYALDINTTERMVELLVNAGFKRGLDADHLKQSLSEQDQDYRFSLKFALDRLALGIAIPEHAIFDATLSYAQVLPSDFEMIGTLIEIYQDFAHRRDWMTLHEKGKAKPVERWLDILKTDIEEFQNAGAEALQAVHKIVKKQYTMLTLSYHYATDDPLHQNMQSIQLPLPYLIAEIQNSIDSQLEQALPTGQITFSQIGHIRPIPYKLMVMLNLDSGKFPNRNTQLPFDLMSLLKPQLGDRSRLEDDQGAFLDALLLAKENLWLFYNGFDVSDGEVRDPSSVLQELISHVALITKSESQSTSQTTSKSKPDSDQHVDTLVSLDGIEVPQQIQQLYHVHPLQPFDPLGFEEKTIDHQEKQSIRYQDHWFAVARQIRQASGQRQPWVNEPYAVQQDAMTVLDAGQWIQDVTFPARLYLKTLGVENLRPEDIPANDEPLILDGLGRYAIRDFLQQHDQLERLDFNILQDQLPVGKVQHSTLQISLAEQQSLKQRLNRYAATVTATTQRQWRISPDLTLNITVPKQLSEIWLSLDASSARAKRRVKVWLEYLLWLSYLKSAHPNLSDEKSAQMQRIAVFSDVTILNTGVTATQAHDYLWTWLKAYQYAQTQPLVLPSALLLLLAEKGKQLEWQTDEFGQSSIANFQDVQKEWDKSDSFLPFSLADMEWSKRHRDWQFILQEQDTTALLKYACDEFAYDLYQPIYQHQSMIDE